MSEELVVEQCSPTMAGLKTGNLFSCPAEDTRTLWQSIRRLNQRLVPCGIRLVPVKSLGDRELIYMYRQEKLLPCRSMRMSPTFSSVSCMAWASLLRLPCSRCHKGCSLYCVPSNK